jgi:very-short-patch-repair endonuclease
MAKKLTTEEFIKRSKEIHENTYIYPLFKYENTMTKVPIKCRIHGLFYQGVSQHMDGQGCPKCNISKGETKIMDYFKRNKIKFKDQKTFKTCKSINKLKYDFYIPKYRLLIEFDGGYHFKNIMKNKKYFGEWGLDAWKRTHKRDLIKTKWAKDNGYTLLRIPYTKFNKI